MSVEQTERAEGVAETPTTPSAMTTYRTEEPIRTVTWSPGNDTQPVTEEIGVDVVRAGVDYPPTAAEAGPPEPEPAVQAAPPRSETERLMSSPTPMVLTSGTAFDLEALRLRQFLRLLRIITRGAADVLDSTRLDFENPQEFVQTFLGMILFSIPEAEEETVDFLKSMVRPVNLSGDTRKDLIRVQELANELDNPELEDTVTIIQCVIENEAEDLRALGKRLATMFQVAQKMGATKA